LSLEVDRTGVAKRGIKMLAGVPDLKILEGRQSDRGPAGEERIGTLSFDGLPNKISPS